MPKISVIVPMYNLRNYIAKCMESLINQSLYDIEIIVVDDGSIDYCSDIVEHYIQLDQRIRLIKKNNDGVSSARNVGIRAATGEYILMVDGDDWIEIECLESSYRLAEKNNLDVVVFDYCSVRDYKKTYINDVNICNQEIITGKEYLIRFFEDKTINPTICNKLVSSILYKQYGHNPEGVKMCEDLYTIGKLMFYCERVGKISKPYYNYLKRADSAVHNITEAHLMDRVKVVNALGEFYSQYDEKVLKYFEAYKIIQLIEYLYCDFIKDKTEFFDKALTQYLVLNKKYKFNHNNINVRIVSYILRVVPSTRVFRYIKKLRKRKGKHTLS